MISQIRNGGLLVGAVLASTAVAGPVVLGSSPINVGSIGAVPALPQTSSINVGSVGSVPSIPHGPGPVVLGNYPLSTTLRNDVLLDIDVGVHVEALDSLLWGSVIVSTGGATKDESLIGGILSFFENPIDIITAAIGLAVRVDFENVGGHFEFGVKAPGGTTFSVPILEADLYAGIDVGLDVTAGLRLAVDVVFAIDAAIDLNAGFEFDLPEGSFITVDAITGDIIAKSFVGGDLAQLPITVRSGSATFQAALRVRLEVGTEVEIFGTGFEFELGVFVDLIQYTALIESTPKCELFIQEWVDLAVGAFALVVVDIDYNAFLAVPADVTVLLGLTLESQCLPRSSATSSSSSALITGAASTSSSISSPSSSSLAYTNGTTTSAAALTTSTVTSTDVITVTSCSSTVLHCPTSLTSLVVVTSTKVLYTTVCPVTETQKPTYPASISYPTNTPSSIVSAHTLTPVSPVVSTVYVPSVVTPTYTVPYATSYAASSTGPNAGYSAIAAITPAPTYVPSYPATTPAASGVAAPTGGNSTTSPTGSVTPPSTPYVNGAARSGTVMSALAIALVGAVALM